MKIIANGITSITELNEVMGLIENEFTTDKSTSDNDIMLFGSEATYNVKISVYYDDVQLIEIEVM